MLFYTVKTGTRTRFSTLSKAEAVAVATRIFNSEGVIPDIFEEEK